MSDRVEVDLLFRLPDTENDRTEARVSKVVFGEKGIVSTFGLSFETGDWIKVGELEPYPEETRYFIPGCLRFDDVHPGQPTTEAVTEHNTPVKSCARYGKDHKSVLFRRFTNPVLPTPYGYWGLCPTNNEPILLSIKEEA